MAMPVKSADLDRWAAEASALGREEIGYGPKLGRLLDESVEVANATKEYWEPVTDGPNARPGLSLVVGMGVGRNLHAGTAEELMSLQRGASDAHSNYDFASKGEASPAPLARRTIRELHAGLEFLFDDGVTDESDERLAGLAASRQEATAYPEIALVLDGYANLAELHREALAKLPTFQIAYLDGARGVAEALRGRPAVPSGTTPDSEAALETRERYATLLQRRLSAVRAAARFVFRDHPEIVRKFTSSHERRKRAASRRKAKLAESAAKAFETAKEPTG